MWSSSSSTSLLVSDCLNLTWSSSFYSRSVGMQADAKVSPFHTLIAVSKTGWTYILPIFPGWEWNSYVHHFQVRHAGRGLWPEMLRTQVRGLSNLREFMRHCCKKIIFPQVRRSKDTFTLLTDRDNLAAFKALHDYQISHVNFQPKNWVKLTTFYVAVCPIIPFDPVLTTIYALKMCAKHIAAICSVCSDF